MPTPEQQYIILWEYDTPLDFDTFLNHEAGIWFWTLSPGNVIVTDDNGNTGYYDYTNDVIYNVKSLLVDDEAYSATTSLADCRITNKSFYYDSSTTKLYIHFDNFDPPLSKQIFVGAATGFTFGTGFSYYAESVYYDPSLKKVFNIKKSKDPLFFGLLSFQSGKVTIINEDGEFDNWRSRNLFGQPTRFLLGEAGDTYDDFNTIFTGFIEDDKRGWNDLSVTLQDVRKGLSQPVARNLLTKTEWPFLDDGNVDEPKPVAYGTIYNAGSFCLNETEVAPTNYTFLIADTEFNNITTLDKVYVAGEEKTPVSTDLAAGTFQLSSADVDSNFSDVTIDFTVDIENGVEIIKDLIINYDSKPFLASFWDLDEVNAAELLSRDTSLYIDDDKKLSEAIEKISFDTDAIFFNKDSGVYTIRIFDENRTPVKTIFKDEWIDDPSIKNNGSEFLTSAVIKYRKDIAEDKFRQFENTSYETATFATYKKYRKETFETGLATLAAATDKSETILDYSSNVQDIIERSTKFQNSDVEIMDFVICDPVSRYSEDETLAVYEVLGVNRDLEDFNVKFTMRYVKDYVPVVTEYSVLVDELGNFVVDENGNTILGVE